MSIVIDGMEYTSHAEYFKKFPWKVYKNKRMNLKPYMDAIARPCADCGILWHPMVITLDHVNRDGYHTSKGKRKPPAQMLGYPPQLFLEELAKCEPVCMNCHAFREFLRDGHDVNKKWNPWRDLILKGALVTNSK